jgi:hypothetical protein
MDGWQAVIYIVSNNEAASPFSGCIHCGKIDNLPTRYRPMGKPFLFWQLFEVEKPIILQLSMMPQPVPVLTWL